MRKMVTTAALALAPPAFAGGDAEAGERVFNNCTSCHMFKDADGEMIVRGNNIGPNLYGVIGRVAGSEDFRYGSGLEDAREAGFIWTEEALAIYVANPREWLKNQGFSSQSKMSYRLPRGGEDVAAYLATFSAAEDAGDA